MRGRDWKTSINVCAHGKLIIERDQEAVRFWVTFKCNGRLLVNIYRFLITLSVSEFSVQTNTVEPFKK